MLAQFLVAEWLSFWAPELGISQLELGNYWKGLNIPHPCGPCNDCAGTSLGTDATYARYAGIGGCRCGDSLLANRKRFRRYRAGIACPLGSPADLRVFGLEGSPTTHSALEAAPVWARAPAGTVSLLNLAGDARPGLVNFSVCDVGSELCKITARQSVAVPSVSVDSFLKERGIGMVEMLGSCARCGLLLYVLLCAAANVFMLAIDTEGHDPIVLKGAEGSLRAGAVEVHCWGCRECVRVVGVGCAPDALPPLQLVMFENGWLDHPTNATVKWLEKFGYACFLEGPRHLFVYTRCWSEPLETWNRWSNTVCVLRVSMSPGCTSHGVVRSLVASCTRTLLFSSGAAQASPLYDVLLSRTMFRDDL